MQTNPITKEEFEDRQQYVESLIESYANIKTQQHQWSEDEKITLMALQQEAEIESPGTTKGTVVVAGTHRNAKVEFKQNASYPKEKGEEHPLRTALGIYPEVSGMVRVEYKEAGKGIGALLERHATGQLKPGDDAELAAFLVKARTIKAGKSAITIEDRVDVTQAAGGTSASPLY